MDEERIRAGISSAFRELEILFQERGGFHYPGDLELKADSNENYGWFGPWAWSEGDYQFHFAKLLEKQFGEHVHLEMPLTRTTRDDLAAQEAEDGTKKRGGNLHVDIVVSDLDDLERLPRMGYEAGRCFRSRTHDAFIEVKRLRKGLPNWVVKGRADVTSGITTDLEWLERHLQKKRCRVAAMLVANEQGARPLKPESVPERVMFLELFPGAVPATGRDHAAG